MGPRKAAEQFLARNPQAASFEVTLYGSLAATGRGHMTDVAILDTLQPHAPVEIIWKPHVFFPFHPNGMTFKAFDAQKKKLDEWTVFSVGGGALAEEGHDRTATNDIYSMNTMSQILYWCEHTGRSYWEYVEQCEGKEIWDFLAEVWETMKAAIHRGLDAEGVLPGPLNLRRKASSYYIRSKDTKILSAPGDWSLPTPWPSAKRTLREENRDGTHLRCLRSGSGSSVPLAEKP